VIEHPAFAVEPWALPETQLALDVLAQTESLFALSNGHIGLRGNLDEGEPHALPGTYLSAFYEVRPLPEAEGGFGYPEAGQALVNVTDGKIIRLLVEDEPFDVRYGTLRRHERVLDFRAGVLRRVVEWESPTGTVVRITSTRLVSFTQRAVAALLWEVEARSRRGARPIRGLRPRSARRCARSISRTTRRGWCWFTPRPPAGCGWPPGWITSSMALRASRRRRRAPGIWAA
jgi:alpha,alpha-trehalose phosphorylase